MFGFVDLYFQYIIIALLIILVILVSIVLARQKTTNRCPDGEFLDFNSNKCKKL